MTDHPLTDAICDDMIEDYGLLDDLLRASYDKGREEGRKEGRDDQLERDAEYFAEYLTRVFGVAPEVAEIRVKWFKEAMRPQQENNND